jgi:hypothetical protein
VANPLDSAILAKTGAETGGVTKVDEIPFDFERRRSSVVVEESGARRLICKALPSYNVFVAPTKQNADLVVDFTYRRALLAALIIHVVRDYVRGHLDLASLIAQVRGEQYYLGFHAEESVMPMAVDIRELAKAFPESVNPGPLFSVHP